MTSSAPESPEPGRLDWVHRRRPTGSTERHTSRVRRLRVLLPAIAFLLLGSLIAWPLVTGVSMVGKPGEGGLEMVNPTLAGTDEQGQDYKIKAERLERDSAAATETLLLAGPSAALQLKDGGEVRLTAKGGRYRREDGKLDVEGGLTVTHSDGFTIETERAAIDLEKGRVDGPSPVRGHGPQGQLSGDRFRIEDGGETIIVEGAARLRLNGATAQP